VLNLIERKIKELEEKETKPNPPQEEPSREQPPQENIPNQNEPQQVSEGKCSKCQRIFRVGEKHITENTGKKFCLLCILNEVRCDGCFEAPNISPDEYEIGETIHKLGE
jgi:hypothetical protein